MNIFQKNSSFFIFNSSFFISLMIITASILSADLSHLQDEVDGVSSADWIQVDVMDGHFVPNLSFGAPVMRCVKTTLPLDIHLMVSNPADRLQEFVDLKPKNITFHAEAVTTTPERTALIDRIHAAGMMAGIALNPDTPLSTIDDVFEAIDLLLVMSVHPGFSGQSFIPAVLEKVREARKKRPDLMIQMDGGINTNTASLAKEAGANNLVAASAIFGAQNRSEAILQLRC